MLGFFAKSGDILRIRIDSHEGIMYSPEQDCVRRLGEHREILIYLLIEDRDDSERLAVVKNILHTGTVVFDVLPGDSNVVTRLDSR